MTDRESTGSGSSSGSDADMSALRGRRSFLDLPISARLQASILLSTGFAVLLMGALLAWRTLADAREDLLHRVEALTRVLEVETASALVFRDAASGRTSLSALREVPQVAAARLLDASGGSVGRYLRDPLEAEVLQLCPWGEEGTRFIGDHLVSTVAVDPEGEVAGWLCVVAEAPSPANLLPRYGGALFLVSAVVILLGIALASWLTRTVSVPVIELANAVTAVSRGGTESPARLDVTSRDELGRLARAINRLLRTLQERQRDLRAAKEEAERASRVKSEFLANMSHELRTPLNGVLGMTDLLAMSALDEEQREYVETIQVSGNLLLAVINDILDFSRMESGRMELHPRRFELEGSIRAAIDVSRAAVPNARISVGYEIDPGTPQWLVGDEKRLRQILVNLVGNALKFTEEGEVRVRVEELGLEEGRVRLLFRVSDTGPGIPEEERERLFDAFSQGARGGGEGSGSGLGLAISARLVELQGGEIWVESEEDRGSDFYFTVEMGVASEIGAAGEVESLAAATRPDLGPLEILVVDDNEVNRRVTRSQLGALGARVTAVASGHEALERVERAPAFDLVLMDCQMPEMDGFEATRRIRALPGAKGDTPIVGLTAYILESDRRRCLDAGMDDHLAKPVTLEALGSTVRRFGRPADGAPGGEPAGRTGAVAPGPVETIAGKTEPEDLPVLDPATWDRLARLEESSGPGLRRDLVQLFLESLPRHRDRLNGALEEGAGEQLAEAAHSIKGSAGTLGGLRVHAAARETERAARDRPAEDWPEAVSRLRRELLRLEEALAARLDE